MSDKKNKNVKKNGIGLLIGVLILSACTGKPVSENGENDQMWKELEAQESVLVSAVDAYTNPDDGILRVSPRSLTGSGDLVMVPSADWCSGFFPGCLWYLYEKTHDDSWRRKAEKYTQLLADQQLNGKTHDMGFKMFSSYGNGYRLTGNDTYRKILIQSARTLVSRFNSRVGCIRSWDHGQDKWKFPVIIDNMMNLELLFWASKETGDSVFYKVAETHALTTLKNHFRDDFSCYHVVDYDPETGEVLNRSTHQGYSDESAWSRGQAWALYGFTMAYRETGNPAFLTQARHIAGFLFSNPHMPDDFVPYWDFDAPQIPNEPRDASAAAVIASALLELKKYIPEKSADYNGKALRILHVLSAGYRSAAGSNQGFLLSHSTGSKPHHSEVDVPLIYADYYYLEALNRSGY